MQCAGFGTQSRKVRRSPNYVILCVEVKYNGSKDQTEKNGR